MKYEILSLIPAGINAAGNPLTAHELIRWLCLTHPHSYGRDLERMGGPRRRKYLHAILARSLHRYARKVGWLRSAAITGARSKTSIWET